MITKSLDGVVNNNGLGEVSSKHGEVLYVKCGCVFGGELLMKLKTRFAVQSVAKEFIMRVYLIENNISVASLLSVY